MALIAGLEAANAGKGAMLSALLIAAVADNLTDSLSVHMYQESERMEQKEVFRGTFSNLATRFIVCLSFVVIVGVFRGRAAAVAGIAWGMSLLAVLTYILAQHRRVSVISELGKHLAAALVIIVVSQAIGRWINTHLT